MSKRSLETWSLWATLELFSTNTTMHEPENYITRMRALPSTLSGAITRTRLFATIITIAAIVASASAS